MGAVAAVVVFKTVVVIVAVVVVMAVVTVMVTQSGIVMDKFNAFRVGCDSGQGYLACGWQSPEIAQANMFPPWH